MSSPEIISCEVYLIVEFVMFRVLVEVEHVRVVAETESVSGVPDAPLGLLPVARHVGPLLVDGLLDDGLLIIPALYSDSTNKTFEWLVLVLTLFT